jgi:hypothetical protein
MTAVVCTHLLGTLPCTNDEPHKGEGLGCTHDSGSWVPDRHDKPGRGDGE